jgi:hypothetical protein
MNSVKDGFAISLKGHVLIRDPVTGETLLDKPNAIHAATKQKGNVEHRK